jgi:DnaJ-class molecular chaperone
LSNEEKKQAYDTYGHAGVDGQQQPGGGGGFGGFGGPFGGFQGGQQVDAEEMFDMFEGMFGGQASRGRGRDVQQHCSLSFLEAVNGCERDIVVHYTDRSAPNQKKTKTVKVKIPAGVDDGVLIRVSNEGGGGMKGKPNGDLRLHINVQRDAYFARDGPNVHVDKPLSLTQAILGGSVDVLTLGGMVEVKVPPGTQPGAKLVLRGKGIKDVNSIYK